MAWLLLLLVSFPFMLGTAADLATVPTPAPADRFYPGDQIRIEVFDNPDLSMTLVVPAGGTTAFPLIGDLPDLCASSPALLTEDLTRRLGEGFLRHPQVTVTVLAYGVRQVHVLGSVGKPGALKLVPGVPMTPLQAISEAGGFDPTADRSGTFLVRPDPAGGRSVQALGAVGARDTAGAEPALLPGDVVVVPASDRAYVLGRVQRPGAISFPGTEPITVTKALSLAGGFDRFAVDDAVQLLRPQHAPQVIDVEAILGGKAEDVTVLPGDTVFVPESRL